MNIKGFDKDLKCRGFQFEVGKEYKTGAKKLELCTETVFHFCDSIQKVHSFYDVRESRFCEVEALGKVVKDEQKCGTNHIRIVREITGEELNTLIGKINGNTGIFNSGDYNSGDYNSGNYNSGNYNSGDYNTGYYNSGDYNSGDYNSGDYNSGNYNSGDYNTGYYNSGNYNSGDYNSGNYNSGDYNSGNYNSGNYNSGDYNSGNYNSGDYNSGNYNSGNYNSGGCNSGDFNSCDFSSGVFCNKDPEVLIFNQPSGMTMREFRDSQYFYALYSETIELTYWEDDELKTRSYKEACQLWWKKLTKKNQEIIKSMPNFDKDIFNDITGIEIMK